MSPRLLWLYLDADVYQDLARELRRRGFDAVAATEVGTQEYSDAEHLSFAVSQGRAILTFNRGDFVRLHTQYMQHGWEHFGIIVSEQYKIGETLQRTLALLSAISAEDMMNRLEYLSQWR